MNPIITRQPESPVDTCMFPPVYDHDAPTPKEVTKASTTAFRISVDSKKLPSLTSAIKAEPKKFEPLSLAEADLEPFEFNPQLLSSDEPLSSVFGDADLINSIMTSLEAEPIVPTSAAPLPALTPLPIPLLPTPLVLLPTVSLPTSTKAPSTVLTTAASAPTSSFPCLRKPGTFLNKDGRWIKGKPCRIGNCDKRAQSNGLCKGHGGGARCSVEGCSKSSQGGGLCRAHGGGKRCLHEGCEKGTQRNGFCYLHGGVRSCSVEGCERKDRGNGKCFAHGGGRRCQAPYCLTTIRKGTFCEKHQSLKPTV